METMKHGNHLRSVLAQANTNASLWIGHLQKSASDHFGGQTFCCPSDGLLDNIQLFSSAVQYPGEITLTLHEFEIKTKTWEQAICSSRLIIRKGDHGRWIRFDFSPIVLQKGTVYGFRLQSHNALIALGEAASDTKLPFSYGYEWKADTKNEKGHFFSYFSLAFNIEMCA
ncbi:MAG: hypothetical protein JST17_02105 [Bacteroidetes bacterium]|nr:hypothetical protein [Bacteroidota bacterium]MBS1931380.1 hypothetical protein [Bacteroidota bacterium]